MHIKTNYGDGGLLKVSMYKEDDGYRVVGKSRIKNAKKVKDWRTVDDFKGLTQKQAKEIYSNIYGMF